MKKVIVFVILTIQCAWGMAQNNVETTVHSEVMAWSNITGVRMNGELIDFESALCVGVLGGKMERRGVNGRETSSTIGMETHRLWTSHCMAHISIKR